MDISKEEMVLALEALKEEIGKEAFDEILKEEKIAVTEQMFEAKVATEALAKEYVEKLRGSDAVSKDASDEDIEKVALDLAVKDVTELVEKQASEKDYMFTLGSAQGAGFAAGFKAAMETEEEKEDK